MILVQVNKEFFVKDPSSTELGKNILNNGLLLLSELGLEDFTFKKLAQKIGTTESTIYRYFENKNQLLFYLFNYYWSWMEYQLNLAITNIENSKLKLSRAIKLITKTIENDSDSSYLDLERLQEVIILESSKTFLSKKVDLENKMGYFHQYKQFVDHLSKLVLEINADYPYSHALMSTIIESSFHQRFFAEHLPKLTDKVSSDENLEDFFNQLALQTITNYKVWKQ
jgi:AcrR family transcriptional regulator